MPAAQGSSSPGAFFQTLKGRETPSGESGATRKGFPPFAHCGQSLRELEGCKVAGEARYCSGGVSPSFSLFPSLYFLGGLLGLPSSPPRAGGSGEEGTRRGPLREAWQSAGASFHRDFIVVEVAGGDPKLDLNRPKRPGPFSSPLFCAARWREA